VQYDAATSFSSPGWEDSELSSFLNLAQDRLVEELYISKNFANMSNIVRNIKNLTLSVHPDIANAVYSKISVDVTDFLYYVTSRTLISSRTKPTITNEYIHNEIVDIMVAPKFFKTAINQVWFKYPKVFFENTVSSTPQGNSLVILYDNYTTTPATGELVYVKYPVRIKIEATTVPCELNLMLHAKVVEYAVQEALKAVKIGKVSTQS
jgi:hypothetical protein